MPKEDYHNADQNVPETPEQLLAKMAQHQRAVQTTESTAYLQGLYTEFVMQKDRYHDLTANLREIEARLELAEKMLSLVRDHLAASITKTEFAEPHDWKDTLRGVRFVGVRLMDACVELLRAHKKMTGAEMVAALNEGMFRFRTNSPLREIHAALMRQQRRVKKTDDGWKWVGTDKTTAEPIRLVKTPRAEDERSERK